MRISIDPGSAGGIAVDRKDGTVAYKMPDTDTNIIEFFTDLYNEGIKNSEKVLVMMEKVTGYIGGREIKRMMPCPHCRREIEYYEKQADPASTMFNFGDGNGFLRACCLMAGFRFETVPPRTWQACFGLKKDKFMTKTAWKNLLKDKAQKLFPHIKVTLATADALLILEYSKRIAPVYIPPRTTITQTNLLF